jgi:hypothetical protein
VRVDIPDQHRRRRVFHAQVLHGGRDVADRQADPAGMRPGLELDQFISPHGLAVDSRGDIDVGEVSFTNWGNRFEGQGHPLETSKLTETRQGRVAGASVTR